MAPRGWHSVPLRQRRRPPALACQRLARQRCRLLCTCNRLLYRDSRRIWLHWVPLDSCSCTSAMRRWTVGPPLVLALWGGTGFPSRRRQLHWHARRLAEAELVLARFLLLRRLPQSAGNVVPQAPQAGSACRYCRVTSLAHVPPRDRSPPSRRYVGHVRARPLAARRALGAWSEPASRRGW